MYHKNGFVQCLTVASVLLTLSIIGCKDDSSGSKAGEFNQACIPQGEEEGLCDEGLVCVDDVCLPEDNYTGKLGEACFDNGTCNPGLTCDGTVCIATVEETPRGTLSGACYENGTCNPGLACESLVCVAADEEVEVGTLAAVCFPNGTCDAGLYCEANVCVAEPTQPSDGALSGACFANGTCNTGLECDGTTCVAAVEGIETGAMDGECYPNGSCNPGLICQAAATASEASICVVADVEAGEENGMCYNNGTCNGGLICQRNTCVASALGVADGEDGGICFANGSCNGALVCAGDNICVQPAAGSLHGDCLENNVCAEGLVCMEDLNAVDVFTCEVAPYYLGSIHGVVTDFVTNDRLAAVTVTTVHQGEMLTTTTDALGYYYFDNLVPGHYELTFSVTSHAVTRFTGANELQITCDDDTNDNNKECHQTKDVELYPFTATVTGNVYTMLDGVVSPADETLTLIADYKPAGEDISPDRFTISAGTDGSFTFTNLPAAEEVEIWTMPYSSGGNLYATQRVDVDLTDGGTTRMADLYLVVDDGAPPFMVDNNFEEYSTGGFPITQTVQITFSKEMETVGFTADIFNGVNPIATTSSWDTTATVLTITPAEPLDADTEYTVVLNGESQIDDLPFVLGAPEGNFITEKGIKYAWSNIVDSAGVPEDEFVETANIQIGFTQAPILTDPEAFVTLYRQRGAGDVLDTDLPIEMTYTVSGNVITIDPAEDLIPGATYYVDYKVFSSLAGDVADADTTLNNPFTVRGSNDLELVDVSLGVVNDEFEMMNPSDNIELTFNQSVNLAASTIRLEQENGFGIATTVTLNASDDSVMIINPAIDLVPGDQYRLIYTVEPVDVLAEGIDETILEDLVDGLFKVSDTDDQIAYLGSNIIDPYNYDLNVELSFSMEIDATDGLLVVTDDEGDEVLSETVFDGAGSVAVITDDNGDDTVLEISVPVGGLDPATTYTIQYKVYGDGSSLFTEGELTLTTEEKIAVTATNVRPAYTFDNPSLDVYDDFVTSANITATFTVDIDTAYHEGAYVEVYDKAIRDALGGTEGQVGAVVSFSTNTVTVDPVGDLRADNTYVLSFKLCSDIVRLDENGDEEPEDCVTEEFEFTTLPDDTVTPVEPPAAAVADFALVDAQPINYDATTANVEWTRVTDAEFYAVFWRDDADQTDYIYLDAFADDDSDSTQTHTLDFGDTVFDEGVTVEVIVAGYNIDNDGTTRVYGPFTTAVSIHDNVDPSGVTAQVPASADNTAGGAPLDVELTFTFDEPLDVMSTLTVSDLTNATAEAIDYGPEVGGEVYSVIVTFTVPDGNDVSGEDVTIGGVTDQYGNAPASADLTHTLL